MKYFSKFKKWRTFWLSHYNVQYRYTFVQYIQLCLTQLWDANILITDYILILAKRIIMNLVFMKSRILWSKFFEKNLWIKLVSGCFMQMKDTEQGKRARSKSFWGKTIKIPQTNTKSTLVLQNGHSCGKL